MEKHMGPIGSKRYLSVVCYDMQLDGGEEGKSAYANLSLRVVEGPETGRNLWKKCYLSEKARDISIKQLRALGWTGTKLSKAMSEGLGTRKASAMLLVKQGDDGKIREEVNGIYEPKAFTPKNPVDNTSLDAFDALFEDAASAIAAETELSAANKAPPLPPAANNNGTSKPVVANPNDLGF
jgi:hypothetical protein